ncbi:MAG: STAS-like domain-containing protein [Rhodocyclaceae bacterium]|nr:STAS-like domain-containing protein [Rhodocyclaceae bacterium]MCA3596221.1 STAS-like domain-containing protein [Methylobacterium sp.]MCA3602604.1 STAS-like domain-containing protein [Methylobacterium sp.]MCA3613443.1 STAS-like domain-containing protein [Methylobacterium sp.]MCA3613678.1 STAS-like domain-containing protein [Methylobacterium sp.]
MATVINIAKDFSPFPGGRERSDGPHTGQAFREDFLAPALEKGHVTLVLDGVMGLPSSFFEEALGGLVRTRFTLRQLRELLTIEAKTARMSLYPARGWDFIERAAMHPPSPGPLKKSA